MRIAAYDLETTDLKAFMGIVLCGSIQEIVPPGYYRNHHNKPAVPYTYRLDGYETDAYDPNPDRELVVAIRDELETYNLVVGWNNRMFDDAFLNARLLFHGERRYRPQFSKDLMYYAGGTSNRIGSRKLVSVQQFLGLDEEKTRLNWDIWKRASKGDRKAMNEVVHHCEQDVKVLALAYWKLLPYVANLHRSS